MKDETTEIEGEAAAGEPGTATEAGADLAEGGGTSSGPTTPEEVEEAFAESELEGEMARLQGEFDELNDRHLRLAAEFNNYRKRAESERTETWARAQADLLRRLLDALDDLERVAALDTDNASVEAIMEGIDLVHRKILRTLEDAGAEVVDPAGEDFDPNTMEAMMRVPAESDEADDTVQQVLQKGYLLKGHLVRPARVAVYKVD